MRVHFRDLVNGDGKKLNNDYIIGLLEFEGSYCEKKGRVSLVVGDLSKSSGVVVFKDMWRDNKSEKKSAEHKLNEAGFFTGLLHGFFVIPRLIVSMVDEVDVYSDNSGPGYLVGFVLGILILLVALLSGSGNRSG